MSQTFAELGISKPVVRALTARGITAPFPIQNRVIRDVLAGKDVLVQSPTGSGKTLAFGAPLIDRLEPGAQGPAALVLAPTRELASQIVDECQSLAKVRQLRIAAVYGGVGFGPQISAAQRADVIVATPGRLEDLLERGVLKLDRVRVLVLDEADRMLDMGFRPAVDRIVGRTPRSRQALFFSATLEGDAGKIAGAYTSDARRHEHVPAVDHTAETEHRFVRVQHEAKVDALVAELKDAERGLTIVFVRTKRGADRLVKRLKDNYVTAVAMHGDKSQSQREKALARFESGHVDTLVATDVAARGLDIEDLPHVVNFELPWNPQDYVHRIGRTGRAGATGEAISLVCIDEADLLRGVQRLLRKAIPWQVEDGFVPDRNVEPRPLRGGGMETGGGARGARPSHHPHRKPVQYRAGAGRS